MEEETFYEPILLATSEKMKVILENRVFVFGFYESLMGVSTQKRALDREEKENARFLGCRIRFLPH